MLFRSTLQPGTPPLVQGIILDVTDRQRMIDALRASEERLQSIIDNTSAVIYLKDPTGRYQLINRSYEKLFGVKREELIGKNSYDVFPREIADAFRANDLKVIAEARPFQFDEVAPHDDLPTIAKFSSFY